MHIRYGEVVSVRLAPEDIMSCIDIVKEMGIQTRGMSLSMCVKVAVSALMAGMRESKGLPVHEGFEYTEMVKPFLEQSRGIKGQYAHVMSRAIAGRMMAELPSIGSRYKVKLPHDEPIEMPDAVVTQRGRWLVRISELEFKQQADPLNFDASEQAELQSIQEQYDASKAQYR